MTAGDTKNEAGMAEKSGAFILPVLPPDLAVVGELRRELASSSPNSERVSRIILQDPALTLAFAQSTYSVQQGLGDPLTLTNPWQMVVRLGIDRAIALVDQVANHPQPIDRLIPAFSHHRKYTLRIAQFARTIMRHVNPQLVEASELLGIIGGIGYLLALLMHRDRFQMLVDETTSYAKLNYRLQKELNFELDPETTDFLRLSGIPEKLVACVERDPNSPGNANQVELRTCFLSAVEITNVFDEGRSHIYDPKRPLPANSSLRLFQLTDQGRAKLFDAFKELLALATPPSPQEATEIPPAPAALQPASTAVTPTTTERASDDSTTATSTLAAKTTVVEEPEEESEQLDDTLMEAVLSSPTPPCRVIVPTDEAVEEDINQIKPLNGFTPSAARQKRIRQLRSNAREFLKSLDHDPAAAEEAVTVTDAPLAKGQATIDAIIKHNPVISDAIRGIQRIESMFSGSRMSQARELTVGVVQLITDHSTRYQAALYFAAKAYYPHLLEREKRVSIETAIETLIPSEVAAIIGLSHVVQQLQSRFEKQRFTTFLKHLKLHIEIGRIAGSVVPGQSAGRCMTLAGIRLSSAAILHSSQSNSSNRYFDALRSGKHLFDASKEAEEFGTSHLDISAFLLQRLGYGAGLAQTVLPTTFKHPMSPSAQLLSWVESMHLTNSPFNRRDLTTALKVDRDALPSIRDRIQKCIEDESYSNWLCRDKSDIAVDGQLVVKRKK